MADRYVCMYLCLCVFIMGVLYVCVHNIYLHSQTGQQLPRSPLQFISQIVQDQLIKDKGLVHLMWNVCEDVTCITLTDGF